ncbi:hypothetical protein DIZ76_010011 [Coccidioides immitis]|nr:hypothetical protein DIZ76_010011 [Coccidioides immitis]
MLSDITHAFCSEDGSFAASVEKPSVPASSDLSLSFCDDESLLYAAAAAQRVSSPDKYRVYRKIIEYRNLNEKFKEVCENRNAVIIEYLELVKREWLEFTKKLDEADPRSRESMRHLKWILYNIQHRMNHEIGQHPKRWRPVLDIRLSAIADCIGRVNIIARQHQSAIQPSSPYDWKPPLTSLMFVEERCQQELAELQEEIADLKVQSGPDTLTDRPSVPQSLLNLTLVLLRSDHPAVRRLRGKEVDVISWTQIYWEKRCCWVLSDDDYEGLALTLSDFAAFDGIILTGEKLKNQDMALMARLRAIAGEISSDMMDTPPMSNEFSVAANIMLICTTSAGIFGITPVLEGNIGGQTDLDDHAAQLRRSPLYQGKKVTARSAAGQLYCVLLSLQFNGLTIQEDDLASSSDVDSRDLLPVRRILAKRPSDHDIGGSGGEKRQKSRHDGEHGHNSFYFSETESD